MAVRKLTLTFVASMAMIWGARGFAQNLHEGGLPFVDPLQFEQGITMFDPVHPMDLMDVKPQKRASVGFYGTYDRMALMMSRPRSTGQTDSGSAFSDRGWGNRMDFGYMTPEDRGWSMSYWDMKGPNSYDEIWRNRVDLNNIAPAVALTNTIVQPPGFTTFTPVTRLPTEVNDYQYGYRLYKEKDSLNVASITGTELNRTFRLKPYSHGGILEPLVGLRYMKFHDLDLDSTYLGPTAVQPLGPVIGIEAANNVTELIREVSFNTDNQMFGGQIGFRYFRFDGRWNFSTDFKVLALENFWKQKAQDVSVVTEYTGIGATPLQYEYIQSDQRAYYHDNEFVVGFDLRAEAAYQVTKALTIRAGVQVLDLETGLMRGNALASQTVRGLTFNAPQDVQLFGFTVGLAVNR